MERLQDFSDVDKSKILKEAMLERFEDLRDRKIIEDYEKTSRPRKIEFGSADNFAENKIESQIISVPDQRSRGTLRAGGAALRYAMTTWI